MKLNEIKPVVLYFLTVATIISVLGFITLIINLFTYGL